MGRPLQTGSQGAPAETALLLKPYEPTDLMVLEASLADRDVVQCHWQVPIGESHLPPLGFWNKAQTSSVDNWCLSKQQLLACYWVSAKTKA